jgi:hypothetical protein
MCRRTIFTSWVPSCRKCSRSLVLTIEEFAWSTVNIMYIMWLAVLKGLFGEKAANTRVLPVPHGKPRAAWRPCAALFAGPSCLIPPTATWVVVFTTSHQTSLSTLPAITSGSSRRNGCSGPWSYWSWFTIRWLFYNNIIDCNITCIRSTTPSYETYLELSCRIQTDSSPMPRVIMISAFFKPASTVVCGPYGQISHARSVHMIRRQRLW